VRGKHLVFFASFFHPESMFAQLSGTLSSAPAGAHLHRSWVALTRGIVYGCFGLW
jgi:hypothetical protein